MPTPNLSASEQNAINSVLTTIRVSQALRDRPVQAETTGDLVEFDVTPELIASALALGFSGKVDRYIGPNGQGWFLTLRLVRDGVTWEMCHAEGDETDRAHGWRDIGPQVVT